MQRFPLYLILSALFASSIGMSQAAKDALPKRVVSDWRSEAAHDVAAIHDILSKDHPGTHVRRDSAHFRKWLRRGHEEALGGLEKVKDPRSYYALLQRYVGGFRDSHVTFSVAPDFPLKSLTLAWPGIATKWSGNGYVVGYVDPARAANLPPLGARLIGCDGETADALALRRVDRHEVNLAMPYGRLVGAHRLLWDRGNPFNGRLPRSCLFQTDSGRTRFSLEYRPLDVEEGIGIARSTYAAAQSAHDIQPWGEGRWRIGIPSLSAGLKWDGFFSKLESNLEALRPAELILVDVRGNGGGASRFVTRLARTLWGQPMIDARTPDLGPLTYRNSARNRKHYADMLAQAEAPPAAPPATLEWLRGLVAAFDEASAAGRALFHYRHDLPKPLPGATAENPVRGRIILLTDAYCASACLDLMDRFLAMPNVVHAGTETYADTIFMDVRTADLPSGMGRLGFPHVAWQKRPRGSNVTYKPRPALTFTGDMTSETEWNKWLERLFR